MSDLVKAQAGALMASGRKGFEDIAPGDVSVPRFKLLQALSPECADRDSGMKPGDIILTSTKRIIGSEAARCRFVPVFSWKEWVRWEGIGESAKLLWRSRDSRDPRVIAEGRWTGGEKPLAQETRHFLCLLPGEKLPAILSFAKTNFNAGKQLYTACYAGEGDMFSNAYELSSKTIKSDKGTYSVYLWKHAGKSADEEFATANEWCAQFAGIRETIDAQVEE